MGWTGKGSRSIGISGWQGRGTWKRNGETVPWLAAVPVPGYGSSCAAWQKGFRYGQYEGIPCDRRNGWFRGGSGGAEACRQAAAGLPQGKKGSKKVPCLPEAEQEKHGGSRAV
jgi:hypothetical protein